MGEEMYIFYADVYFIQNFLIKLGVLLLMKNSIKIPMKKPMRTILIGAVLATLFEIIGLFLCPLYFVFILMVHFIEIPIIVLFLVRKQWQYIWKGIVSGYFWMLVLNGGIEILWNFIPIDWAYPFLVWIGAGVGTIGLTMFLQKKRREKGIYLVDLYRPRIIWTVRAFYDSGNVLKEPESGRAIHIISVSLANDLDLDEEKKRTVNYESLGNHEGSLAVYEVERMKICTEYGWKEYKNVLLGVDPGALLDKKPYKMILNEEVL